MMVFNLIWNDCILPSISIFIWRLLANRVPVDAKLQWRKISLASKCRCCKSSRIETREHLFLHGEVAVGVWGKIASWFPNMPIWNANNNNLESRIRFWHSRLCRTPKPHASFIIPCLALWFLWSQRNGLIHRGALFTAETVLSRVEQHLQQLISGGKMKKDQWSGSDIPDFFDTSSWRVKPRKQIRLVRWIPPDSNWIKLNSSARWSGEEMGAGGILRDDGGNLIRGYTSKILAASPIEAELQALSLGLDLVRGDEQGIWIECGLAEVAALLHDKKYGSASVRHQITEIRNKLNHGNVKISHITKEGNKAAVWLAHQGCKENSIIEFDQSSALSMVKALIRMDQLGLPNFQFQ